MDTMQTQSGSGKKGSSLAIIIIILIVALGGAYFWYSRSATAPTPASKVDMKTKPSVSTASLQNDLNTAGSVDITTDMKGLDQVYK